MSIRDPDARCSCCDVRLSRVDPDHESRCIRKADGWPAFRDERVDSNYPPATTPMPLNGDNA